MSDLSSKAVTIAELRELADCSPQRCHDAMLWAADEIERLRAIARPGDAAAFEEYAAARGVSFGNRQCQHDAISPKGTMFYHGFVSGGANLWRCDVCNGLFEANLSEPGAIGSQALKNITPIRGAPETEARCLVPNCEKPPMPTPFCEEHTKTVGAICGTAVELVPAEKAVARRCPECKEPWIEDDTYCRQCGSQEAPEKASQPLPGGTPIGEYVAELEKDPEMKARLDAVRAQGAIADVSELPARQVEMSTVEKRALYSNMRDLMRRADDVDDARCGDQVTIRCALPVGHEGNHRPDGGWFGWSSSPRPASQMSDAEIKRRFDPYAAGPSLPESED